jgi:hypothetical protein
MLFRLALVLVVAGVASICAIVFIVPRESDGIPNGSPSGSFLHLAAPNRLKEPSNNGSKLRASAQFQPNGTSVTSTSVTLTPTLANQEGKSVAKPIQGTSKKPDEERSPWHANWDNSIAICAIMRQENITDVVEWLSYYQCVPTIM